jgi:tRNA (guanosine-2'-O-)-methyltransferase
VTGARVRPLAALVAAALPFAACSGAQTPAAAPKGPELRRVETAPGVVLERGCTPTGPETCFDARDDNCNGILDEGCGVPTGLVQFAAAWNAPKADVDLDVTDPNGELVEVGKVAESGLVKERDCPGRRNECFGQNLENVYLESGEALRGKYRVRVRLEKLGGEEPPITVTLGARIGPKTYALQVELREPEEEREIVLEL